MSEISSPASAQISPVFALTRSSGDVLADQVLVGGLQELHAALADLAGVAGVELLAGFEDDFARIRVDEIDGGLEALQTIGIERHAPFGAVAIVDDAVVEGGEDLFAIEAEGEQQ